MRAHDDVPKSVVVINAEGLRIELYPLKVLRIWDVPTYLLHATDCILRDCRPRSRC